MNANKMLCKPRFFLFFFLMQMFFFFYKDANAKCPYDAHVSFQRYNFHDADVPHDGVNAMFIHDGASARIYL